MFQRVCVPKITIIFQICALCISMGCFDKNTSCFENAQTRVLLLSCSKRDTLKSISVTPIAFKIFHVFIQDPCCSATLKRCYMSHYVHFIYTSLLLYIQLKLKLQKFPIPGPHSPHLSSQSFPLTRPLPTTCTKSNHFLLRNQYCLLILLILLMMLLSALMQV